MSFAKFLPNDIEVKIVELTKIFLQLANTGSIYVLNKLPDIERVLLNALEDIFIPKQIIKQIMFACAIHGILVTSRFFGNLVQYAVDTLSEKGRLKRKIQILMVKSASYSEWKKHAGELYLVHMHILFTFLSSTGLERLDNILGLDKWRSDDNSPLYDKRVLKKRILDIKNMIDQGDVFGLIFRIRGGLARDQVHIASLSTV